MTGRKYVATVMSAESSDTTSVVICMSASETYLPSILIFKKVSLNFPAMAGARRVLYMLANRKAE